MPDSEVSTASSPMDDPLYKASRDNPNMQLISVRFKGSSFLNWKRGITRALIAKNKYGFVNEKIPKPEESAADYRKWLRCIMGGYFKERFGETNGPLYFELGKELYNTQQGNLSIANYFGKLKRIWEDINDIEGFPECTCNAIKSCSCNLLKRFADAENKRKLVQFLMGVDPAYEAINQNLLTMDPLPTINQAFSRLVQAERQRKVCTTTNTTGESSALAVRSTQQFPAQNKASYHYDEGFKKDAKKARILFCKYCKKEGHGIDFCYKLKNKNKRQDTGTYNGANRFASNVEEEKDQDHPLVKEHNNQPQFDDTFLMAVAQRVLQMQSSFSYSTGEPTGAGTTHLSNFVATYPSSFLRNKHSQLSSLKTLDLKNTLKPPSPLLKPLFQLVVTNFSNSPGSMESFVNDNIESDDDDFLVELEKPEKKRKRSSKGSTDVSDPKPRRKRSPYFDHFENSGVKDKLKCKYCKTLITHVSSNGTTALKTHIKRCKNYPPNLDRKQKLIEFESKTLASENGTTEIVNKPKLWKYDHNFCRKQCAKMIIMDELPFVHVEGEGFRAFVQYLNPHFIPPSRTTVARDCYGLFIDERVKFQREKGTSSFVEKKTELDKYLSDGVEDDDSKFDLLGWWKDSSVRRYPILANMAKDVLAMPVSTVASESAFSTGGRVLDFFRTSLTPRMVEALICCQDWLRKSHGPLMIEENILELEVLEESLQELTIEQPQILIDESLMTMDDDM
ncbi:hypothetical protein RND81_11G118100 [Saponaria officinalis]|uniref:BED-type domain-containing protein n=1 Tax=Saponaria officinalis TaxID=3572 RepID=A0AAW1HKR6_SAPOF